VDLGEIQAAYYMVAATGVLVAAAYYILNLRVIQRNQELTLKALEQSAKAQQQTLETRQAQIFINVNDRIQSNEFQTAYDKVVMTPWATWEEYSKLYRDDKEFRDAERLTQGIFEGMGVLVREGLLPVRMVALLICGVTRLYWERHIPVIDEGRRVTGSRRLYSENEYLYDELIKYLGEHPELDTRIEAMP
jgi:hypothetical protein